MKHIPKAIFFVAVVFTVTQLLHLKNVYFPAPVMGDMQMEVIASTNDVVQGHVTGSKVRQCPPLGGSFVGYSRSHGGMWVEVPFEFINDIVLESSRPVGDNDFGVWQWDVDVLVDEVMLSLTHMCKSGRVVTDVGPFQVRN